MLSSVIPILGCEMQMHKGSKRKEMQMHSLSFYFIFNFFVFVSHVLETKTLKCLNAHCFISLPKETLLKKTKHLFGVSSDAASR